MDKLSEVIANLPKLERSQLLDLWRNNFGKTAAPGMRRELMIPVLAYRIQERASGGLNNETLAKLKISAGGSHKGLSRTRSADSIKTGTRIVREWHGETHEVTVAEGGFQYHGTLFKTLSEIARKITGTRWSGPLFFGLRKDEKRKHV